MQGAKIATFCTVRWRPSGGRGEYEFVPAESLAGRQVAVEMLGKTIPAEIAGTVSQGKPRLRKDEPNNRQKLHLFSLVMSVARLPDPAREDKTGKASWPLENKGFLLSHMEFEILQRTSAKATLKPVSARILHSTETIDFQQRLKNIAEDIQGLKDLQASHPAVATAIAAHYNAVQEGKNSKELRDTADSVIALQAQEFGSSNSAAVTTIVRLPPTPFEEDVVGKEGRILTRLHSYKERDRALVKKAKANFKRTHGRLFCECCGFESAKFYGTRGQDRIEAHHRLPIETILPDSTIRAEDLAMVCPNCHDIIHAKRPWISVEALKMELLDLGSHYF